MDMRKLIGRNFKRIRLEKGLTQEMLSESAGFTQQYLSGLEQGRRNPTIVSLYEIALALGVDHVALVAPDEEARHEDARRITGRSGAASAPRAKRETKSKRPKTGARATRKSSRPKT